MRSQASGWAAGCSPEILIMPVLKGSIARKAASPEAVVARNGEPYAGTKPETADTAKGTNLP
jgi:hypothetical protein